MRETGTIPYYGASGVIDHVKDYIFDGDYLLVSEDGANLTARVTPIAFSVAGKTWVTNHAHVLQFEDYETRRYVEIYLNSIDLTPYRYLKSSGEVISTATSDSGGIIMAITTNKTWGPDARPSGYVTSTNNYKTEEVLTLTTDITNLNTSYYISNGFNQSHGKIYEIWLEK